MSVLCDYVENAELPFGDAFRFVIDAKHNMGNFEATVSKMMKAIDCISLHYEVRLEIVIITRAFLQS